MNKDNILGIIHLESNVDADAFKTFFESVERKASYVQEYETGLTKEYVNLDLQQSSLSISLLRDDTHNASIHVIIGGVGNIYIFLKES